MWEQVHVVDIPKCGKAFGSVGQGLSTFLFSVQVLTEGTYNIVDRALNTSHSCFLEGRWSQTAAKHLNPWVATRPQSLNPPSPKP